MNPDLSNKTAIEQLLAVGASLAPVAAVQGGKPSCLVPAGFTRLDMESMLPRPIRKRGLASFTEFKSFVAYVNEHKQPATRIFANVSDAGLTLTALLDFHGENPSWNEHKAKFDAKLSNEWNRWRNVNGLAMPQQKLADFLERNVADVKAPTGAAMLEIVENLTARVDARFENKLAITDGKTRLLYEEDVKINGGGTSLKPGQMDLPRTIGVALPVFRHEPPVETYWRLRPAVANRQITFTLELPNADTIAEQAANAYLARVVTDLELTPLIGAFSAN
jgi:uncharacterized protein YfdQ (DUF2303 family)